MTRGAVPPIAPTRFSPFDIRPWSPEGFELVQRVDRGGPIGPRALVNDSPEPGSHARSRPKPGTRAEDFCGSAGAPTGH